MRTIHSIFGELQQAQAAVLEAIGDDPALSDEEIVRRALLLTLHDPTNREKQEARAFTSCFGSHGWSSADVERNLDYPRLAPVNEKQRLMTDQEREQMARDVRDKSADRWWDRLSQQQSRIWFVDALEAIIADTDTAGLWLGPMIDAALEQVVPVPRINRNGGELITDVRYVCDDLDGIFGFTLALILDEKRRLRKAIKKCRYEYCGRLFLSFPPIGGGPRPSYCIPEHKRQADRQTGAERTERWRKKKRQQTKKKRAREKK